MFIEVKNARKVYTSFEQETYALRDVSFISKQGEFVVLLGPSGSGKSTLLNSIGGIDTLSSGEIYVDNECIGAYDERQLSDYRARRIGFVFQFYNLIPTLTVYENVSIMREIKKDILPAKEVLSQLGLQAKLDKFPSQLSGGEQQRVSIARAICKKPSLLLCDEPTGALDSKTGEMVMEQLYEVGKAYGCTILMVTHNHAIAKASDRVIKIKNGEVEDMIENMHPCSIKEVAW